MDTAGCEVRTAELPTPRGSVSGRLLAALGGKDSLRWDDELVDATDDEDLQLALYCCYELHYRGLPGVDDAWEWEPSLLELRAALEKRFESDLVEAAEPTDVRPAQVVDRLWEMATTGDGPSLSEWALAQGDLTHARELAVHRSAYQLKEADPHTWAIPKLTGVTKATMVSIQSDEYGGGVAGDMHASLFAGTMKALGLDSAYNAYLDSIPGVTLATTNLISLLGLHRRLRGALVGHLALFEMTSVGPMGRYGAWMERLGVPASGRRFYDVHVEADQVHQLLASHTMVGSLVADEPHLAASVIFGAAALSVLEQRFATHVLGCWQRDQTSLRALAGMPVPVRAGPA